MGMPAHMAVWVSMGGGKDSTEIESIQPSSVQNVYVTLLSIQTTVAFSIAANGAGDSMIPFSPQTHCGFRPHSENTT